MTSRQAWTGGKRKAAHKDPLRFVYIICEGEKTEPLYFDALCRDLGILSSEIVEVNVLKGKCAPQPEKIVEYACDKLLPEIRELEQLKDGGVEVYCVIDRDEHHHFDAALERIATTIARREYATYVKSKEKRLVFRAIASYPCFELWYLLHFGYIRAGITRKGDKSPGDCTVSLLKKIKNFEKYEKGEKSHYEKLRPETDKAIGNAERGLKDALATGELNPSTQVHELVLRLRELKNSAK